MSPVTRRVVYLVIYEALAIAIVTLALAFASGQAAEHTGVVAVGSSIIAVVWNFTFNTAFEAWESRQVVRGRSLKRRVAHAVLFEIGLVVMLVPLFAWWLDVSLLHAFILDTCVDPAFRRRGIASALVGRAKALARERGAEWLHVDFEPHLAGFYRKCGFAPAEAGLIRLRD